MQTKSPSTTLPFFYKSTHFLTLSLNLETYSGLFFFSFALLFARVKGSLMILHWDVWGHRIAMCGGRLLPASGGEAGDADRQAQQQT